jgi:hypothetical protein
MSDRSDNRPQPSEVRYPPRSADDFGLGAIIAAIIAAFLVIGIVVYSILTMSQPPQANVQPPPETTGHNEHAPIPPVVRPPADPKTIPPLRPLDAPPVR